MSVGTNGSMDGEVNRSPVSTDQREVRTSNPLALRMAMTENSGCGSTPMLKIMFRTTAEMSAAADQIRALAKLPDETTADKWHISIGKALMDKLVRDHPYVAWEQIPTESVVAFLNEPSGSPVEPSEPRMPLEHYRVENGKLRKAMADLMHKCPRCRAEAKEALSAMTRKAHHPRCELMQPHGHEPPKCTCPSENGKG